MAFGLRGEKSQLPLGQADAFLSVVEVNEKARRVNR